MQETIHDLYKIGNSQYLPKSLSLSEITDILTSEYADSGFYEFEKLREETGIIDTLTSFMTKKTNLLRHASPLYLFENGDTDGQIQGNIICTSYDLTDKKIEEFCLYFSSSDLCIDKTPLFGETARIKLERDLFDNKYRRVNLKSDNGLWDKLNLPYSNQ